MSPVERKRIARIMVAGFALVGLMCASSVILVSSLDLVRQVAARCMGALYLGIEGVELQTKHNDCGPASLKMIFHHFAVPATLSELAGELVPSRHGTSMLALKKAAERRGLSAAGWRVMSKDLPRVPLPAILFIREDHFVVVDSISGESEVFLRDPAVGRLRMPVRRLADVWRGEILLFAKTMQKEPETGTERDLARWSAGDSQAYYTPRIVPRGVVQEDVAGGWDAVGRVTNQP